MNLAQIWRRITPPVAHTRSNPKSRMRAAEIVLLRAENCALLNSILGIAGMPPIPVGLPGSTISRAPLAEASGALSFRRPGSSDTTFTPPSPAAGHSGSPTPSSGGDESLSTPTSSSPQTAAPSDLSSRQSVTRNDSSLSPSSPGMRVAAPIRRRSWHQINRMLELESAKRKDRET